MKPLTVILGLLLSLVCIESGATVLFPPESGCQISDLEIQTTDLIRIRNLRPEMCRLSSGEMISIGLSFGHQFYSGVAAQWAHQGASGKILFHVNAELATSRMLNDVYANSSKLSFDLHIGKSGLFAGPLVQSVLLVNPLISSPQTLRFSGAGGSFLSYFLGSKASRSDSPIRLIEISIQESATVGATSNQAAFWI